MRRLGTPSPVPGNLVVLNSLSRAKQGTSHCDASCFMILKNAGKAMNPRWILGTDALGERRYLSAVPTAVLGGRRLRQVRSASRPGGRQEVIVAAANDQ